MKPGKLSFVASLLAIFIVITVVIALATNTDDKEPAPIFKPDKVGSAGPPAAPATSPNTSARISERVDLNLRECPSSECRAIAVLRRGGNVRLTGKRQMVESSSGAAIPWVEVTSQSEYCTKFSASKKLECIEWGNSGAYSGWVNELYVQSR